MRVSLKELRDLIRNEVYLSKKIESLKESHKITYEEISPEDLIEEFIKIPSERALK